MLQSAHPPYALRLSGAEYDLLLKLLASGKKTVMEAVEIVLGSVPEARIKAFKNRCGVFPGIHIHRPDRRFR